MTAREGLQMGKTQEELAASREIRQKVLNKYGFIPKSVLEIDYSWGKHIIEYEERKQQNTGADKHTRMKYNIQTYETQGGETKEFNQTLDAFAMSSQGVRGKSNGVSTFPPALARFIVEYYSEQGDTVADCCAGHNSRMQVTFELGRNYIGYDVSVEYQAFNENVKQILYGKGDQGILFALKNTITLHVQSSEKMVEVDNSIDMIYTSPPYFSVEHYTDEPEQLGKSETYEVFLLRLKQIISECYRVLKVGKYCIFNVNDFRMSNRFHPFHADVMRLFTEVGFKLHDVVIVKWSNAIGAAFASQVEDRKVTAKSHEYLVVAKKI